MLWSADIPYVTRQATSGTGNPLITENVSFRLAKYEKMSTDRVTAVKQETEKNLYKKIYDLYP